MIWFADYQHAGMQCELRADSESDVPNLAQFAVDNRLKPGSQCVVIGSSSVYMLKSDGTWSKL